MWVKHDGPNVLEDSKSQCRMERIIQIKGMVVLSFSISPNRLLSDGGFLLLDNQYHMTLDKGYVIDPNATYINKS